MRMARTAGLVLAAFVAAAVASSSADAVDRTKVALVGGREPIQVRTVGGADDTRAGRISVVLRSRAPQARRLRIRYVFDEPEAGIAVLLSARSAKGLTEGAADRPRGISVPVGARDLVAVTLDFTLPRGTVDLVRGHLLVVPERWRPPRHVAGPPLALQVAGVRAEDLEVRPDPADVALRVERSPELGRGGVHWSTSGDTATVILRGRGADALLPPAQTVVEGPLAVLHGGGRQVRVLSTMERQGVGQLRVDLKVDKADAVGHYEGRLVFGDSPRAPAVAIKADVRTALWVAIMVVLLGVIAGQLVPRLLSRYRLRADLRRDVWRAIQEYGGIRRTSPRNGAAGMDGIIGRWTWVRNNKVDVEDDARRLLRKLEAARNEDDLQGLEVEVDEVADRAKWWALTESAALDLRPLLDIELPNRGVHAFSASPPAVAGRALWNRLNDPITSEAAAEQLNNEVDALLKVMPPSVEIWELHRELDRLGASNQGRTRLELTALWTQQYPGENGKTLAGELQAAKAQLAARLETRQAALPALQAAGLVVAARVPATVAPMQLTDMASDGASPNRLSLRRSRVWRWVLRSLPELAHGLIALVVASAVYALTLYGDTWGSQEDYVTALAAGFFGKVAIDIARLPLFSSLRKDKVPDTGADTGGDGQPTPPPVQNGPPPEVAKQETVAGQQ
jgi:hypothetical protein